MTGDSRRNRGVEKLPWNESVTDQRTRVPRNATCVQQECINQDKQNVSHLIRGLKLSLSLCVFIPLSVCLLTR